MNFTGLKGFTLIEMLTVVLIVGILAAIAWPQYQNAVEKARATQALIMLKAIAESNKRHYLATGKCTRDMRELDINIPNGTVVGIAGEGYAGYVHITDGRFSYESSPCTDYQSGSFAQIFYEKNTTSNCSKYCLEYRNNNDIICISTKGTPKYNRVCQSLGREATPTLEPGEYCANSVAKCWKIKI
jgi:prepilin-type N-terminal cleavage/methylation domain-containing protein